MEQRTAKRFIVGFSGASGMLYGVRLVERLLADPTHEVHLTISPAAAQILAQELDARPQLSPFDPASLFTLLPGQADRLIFHPIADLSAGPASGTYPFEAVIVCPCSMRTAGAIAAGLADNLLTRAADVALKEGRRLLLVPRETPLSTIHLRNLLTLSEAGAVILPAAPAFYHRPRSIENLVGFVIQKIFDRLGLEFPDPYRWGETDRP